MAKRSATRMPPLIGSVAAGCGLTGAARPVIAWRRAASAADHPAFALERRRDDDGAGSYGLGVCREDELPLGRWRRIAVASLVPAGIGLRHLDVEAMLERLRQPCVLG